MTYPGATTYPGGSRYPAASSGARVSVTAQPTNAPPRVLISLSSFAGTSVTVNRVDASGASTLVRTAGPATMTAGGWVGYDYEAPYNQPVTYTAVTDSNDSDASGTVELAVTQSWLVHPAIPSLSQPILVMNRGDRTRPTNAGVHQPLGRKYPIVITDGQRKAASFPLTLGTLSIEQEQALAALLDDTSPLLLQIVYSTARRAYCGFVSVGQVVEAQFVSLFGSEIETWAMDCQEVDAPVGTLQAQRTWADVMAGSATWQAVKDTFPTWRDVITGS